MVPNAVAPDAVPSMRRIWSPYRFININNTYTFPPNIHHTRGLSSTVSDEGTRLPMPFFVVITFWMSIVFLMFGLLAARNLTVIGVMFVCCLCVALAFFLIVDLDNPRSGFFQISDKTIRKLIEQIAH